MNPGDGQYNIDLPCFSPRGFICDIRLGRETVDGEDYLAIHIKFKHDEFDWSITTGVECRITSSMSGVSSAFYDSDERTFTPSTGYWGYSTFMRWDTFINPSNGFITDNDYTSCEFLIYPHEIVLPG